jgi:hypothetical protein
MQQPYGQSPYRTNEREEKNIVWTKVSIKGMRIPTGTKKNVATRNDAARMTILRVQVIHKPKNVAEKRGIAKRQTRRSANKNITNITIMMRSRDKN